MQVTLHCNTDEPIRAVTTISSELDEAEVWLGPSPELLPALRKLGCFCCANLDSTFRPQRAAVRLDVGSLAVTSREASRARRQLRAPTPLPLVIAGIGLSVAVGKQ